MAEPVVIVGGSLAGLRAADGLRCEGYTGAIVVVGEESHPPYDRPPLSKQVLTGKTTAAGTAIEVPASLDADWLLGTRCAGVDLARRRVLVDGGPEIPFAGLVIASGARPRVLTAAPPGPGVHYLRTVDQAESLAAELAGSRGLAVIGAGFIGLEVACSAASLGVPAVVLEALPVPLERALGAEMGAAVMRWHLSKGVDIRTGVCVEEVVVRSARPAGVRLDDGSVVEADTVVVGVGVEPATGWLEGCGVDLGDGVLCDGRLRVLSGGDPLPGVVAAGDVARWAHPGYPGSVRVEHWTNAVESGQAAARALLHGDQAPPYAPVPYFWSDQHGVKLQFVGQTSSGDDLAVLEDGFGSDRALAAYGRGGRLVAALGMRRPAAVMALQRMIAEGADFPPPMD